MLLSCCFICSLLWSWFEFWCVFGFWFGFWAWLTSNVFIFLSFSSFSFFSSSFSSIGGKNLKYNSIFLINICSNDPKFCLKLNLSKHKNLTTSVTAIIFSCLFSGFNNAPSPIMIPSLLYSEFLSGSLPFSFVSVPIHFPFSKISITLLNSFSFIIVSPL